MKRILLLICMAAGSAFAGDRTDIVNDAAAVSTNSMVVEGAKPSPAIGLSGLPGTLPPQLLGQLPAPPNVLHGQLLELIAQFGDVVIGSRDDMKQVTNDTKLAEVTFAPSPSFGRYRAKWTNDDDHLRAVFTGKFNGTVRWLGTVMVTSKPGTTLLPPADKRFVWETLNGASNRDLSEVIVVPIPRGYGVNVGISSEASGSGISTSIAKIMSLFVGIGPSFSSQNGTTMPAGTWSQQYIVLEKDPNGIPFTIDMVTPQPPAKVAATPNPDVARQIDEARKASALQAEAYAAALKAIREERERILAIKVEVPTDRVVQRVKTCKVEIFKDSDGKEVKMCRGSQSGHYTTTEVVRETAVGTAETGPTKK